jgi:hypothetical protein
MEELLKYMIRIFGSTFKINQVIKETKNMADLKQNEPRKRSQNHVLTAKNPLLYWRAHEIDFQRQRKFGAVRGEGAGETQTIGQTTYHKLSRPICHPHLTVALDYLTRHDLESTTISYQNKPRQHRTHTARSIASSAFTR